jgi:hypothetical protein
MQGKTCFSFKTLPEGEVIAALTSLTAAAAEGWEEFITAS